MHYVYILRSRSNKSKTYIGITNNLNRRLIEHNLNTQISTKRYSPWNIETYIAFSNREKAIEFEKYLKIGSDKAFLKRRFINNSYSGVS